MGVRTSRQRAASAGFVAEHGPCEHCGSGNSLEVFWRDLNYRPAGQMQAVWTMGKTRRDEMAKDLIVLCHECMRMHRGGVPHGGGAKGVKNCSCVPCKDRARDYFRDKMREARRKGRK
jgi:hypothetical protein